MAVSAGAHAQEQCQSAHLTASDAGGFDNFGKAVAIHIDVAAIGAPDADEPTLDEGAVYVFRRITEWVEEQKLVPERARPGDKVGFAVDIDDQVLITGTPGTVNPGSEYVFRRDKTGWFQEQEIATPEDAVPGQAGVGFGYDVGIQGDLAVIGAVGESTLGPDAGAVYVFQFDGSSWVQQQKLVASDGATNDGFGASVALADDVIVVGAPGANGQVTNAGAAYAFRHDGEMWVEEQKLIADDPAGSDIFGGSVSVSSLNGGTALVGALRDDDAGLENGSAYFFTYNGSKWVQTQELFAVDPPREINQQFGRSVAIDGDRLVVGAHHTSVTGPSDGAAYVFRFDYQSEQWVFQELLLPDPIPSTSFFGYSVAISGGTVVCGAYGENSQAGSAYVFNVAPAPGDLDCDGVVGPNDLAELLAQWGECAAELECLADISPPSGGDGIVGPADLAELLANWG